LRHAATGRELRASVGLPGRFNVANAALAVLLVLHAVGEEHLDALAAVLDVPAGEGPLAAAVPGRMEVVGREPDAVVDFAHNPDGMVQALRSLADARAAAGTRGRTLIVFGSAGDRDRDKRPVMGAISARAAALVIVTAQPGRHGPGAALPRRRPGGGRDARAHPDRVRLRRRP
ncbi:glutamate ligase domain-containing protein, partial [Micrococcus sp. HSID17227]|uniref:glutamate ligase domain-containing protein n=1 Tax=Micrococcus sp. HSID17227 TaxID=2419506 RepID=UPI00272A05E5